MWPPEVGLYFGWRCMYIECLLDGQGLAAAAAYQCPEHMTVAFTVPSRRCCACLDGSCICCGAGHFRHKARWKLHLEGALGPADALGALPWVPILRKWFSGAASKGRALVGTLLRNARVERPSEGLVRKGHMRWSGPGELLSSGFRLDVGPKGGTALSRTKWVVSEGLPCSVGEWL